MATVGVTASPRPSRKRQSVDAGVVYVAGQRATTVDLDASEEEA
jgi:hypothetical protein